MFSLKNLRKQFIKIICPFFSITVKPYLNKNKKVEPIRLVDVLNKWDKIEKGNADQMFSIGFITMNGERRFFKKAVKAGARFSLKNNEMRACIPVDEEGNSTSHVTPFSIWRIVSFNGKDVII